MSEMSADMPVTLPAASTVATSGLALVHVPPMVASDSVTVERLQNDNVPAIGAGCVFTVTMVTTPQLPIVYDIAEVPADTPVTFPDASTVATPGFRLAHVPPPIASVNEAVDKLQSVVAPAMAV